MTTGGVPTPADGGARTNDETSQDTAPAAGAALVMAELIMPGETPAAEPPAPPPGDVRGRLARFATVHAAPTPSRVAARPPAGPGVLSPIDRLWAFGASLITGGVKQRGRRRQAAAVGLLTGVSVGIVAGLIAIAWQERETVVGLTLTALVTVSSLFVWWRAGSTTTAAAHLGALLATLWLLTPASRIIYESDRDTGFRPQIYVTTAGGGSTDRLTSSPTLEMEARFAPTSRNIALVHFQDGNSDIYITESDGAFPRNLTRHPAEDRAPAWSPDGAEIAFQSNRAGNWDIYVVRADGAALRKLTNSGANDEAPAWSPDGRTLAFHSDRGGFTHLYMLGQRGGVVPLTAGLYDDRYPAWSPDGSLLAFQSNRDGRWQIYVMRLDGTEVRRVVTSTGNDTLPAWSPTGRSLAFTSDRDGNQELYSVRVDGSGQRRVTETPTNERRPSWPASGMVNWVALRRTLGGWLGGVVPMLRPTDGLTLIAPPAPREDPAAGPSLPGDDVFPVATPRPAPVPGAGPAMTPTPGPRPVPTCAPGSFWC
ncbi:MAG: PD40 domain-containing protein [Chloroflexi bacterium]|nr:PD40 domain-containing protein [Chloroflexota bacterium]